MSLASDQLTVVIILFLFVIVVSIFVKQFIKIAISVLLILVIFKFGFLLTGTDDNFLKQADEELTRAADSIKMTELYDALLDGIGDSLAEKDNKSMKIDYDKLSEMIADTLKGINQNDIGRKDLNQIITEEFKSFNKEEIDYVVNQTELYLKGEKVQ